MTAPTASVSTADRRCGTPRGYRAHRYRQESACLPCRDAWNARNRERHARRTPDRSPRRTRPIEHGTRRGYEAHARRGVPMCGPCRDANAASCAEYRRQCRQLAIGAAA